MINIKKSHLHPTPVLDHLGLQLDSQSMTIRLPGPKIRDLRRSISTVLKDPTQTPCLIHSLTAALESVPTFIYIIKKCLYKAKIFKVYTLAVQESLASVLSIRVVGGS